MPASDCDALREDIRNGELNSWKEIHRRYNDIWKKYPEDKLRHALQTYCEAFQTVLLTDDDWIALLDKGIEIQFFIADQVYESRKKDYENIFRQATFRNEDERLAAWGKLEENDFIVKERNESKEM